MKGGKSAHGESHAKGKADRKKKKRHEYEAKGDKAFGGTNKLNNPHPKKHRKAFPKFKEGGLHKSLGAKPGAKLTAKQHSAAKSGKKGSLAKKQEVFYENMLKHRIGPTPQAREGYRRMAKRINSKGVPKTGAATLMAEMKKQMHRR